MHESVTPHVLLGFVATSCFAHHMSYGHTVGYKSGFSHHSDWSAGLTDRSRGVYRSSTPGGSSESINGEDGHGNSCING